MIIANMQGQNLEMKRGEESKRTIKPHAKSPRPMLKTEVNLFKRKRRETRAQVQAPVPGSGKATMKKIAISA